MSVQEFDSEKTLFDITEAIHRDLKESYPWCKFAYVCSPSGRLTVMIMDCDFPIVNVVYLEWLHRQPSDDPKVDLFTHLARQVLEQIENVIRGYGGQHLDTLGKEKGSPRFWYAGPFFDDYLLHEDARHTARRIHMLRSAVDQLWQSDYASIDKKNNKNVWTGLLPYRSRSLKSII